MDSGPELPSGTVTFLFTDVEGSTILLKQLGQRYAEALAEHQRILRDAFAEHGGHEIDTQGDAFFVAFRRAKDAVAAAIPGQRALAEHEWPDGTELRVRMGRAPVWSSTTPSTGRHSHSSRGRPTPRVPDRAAQLSHLPPHLPLRIRRSSLARPGTTARASLRDGGRERHCVVPVPGGAGGLRRLGLRLPLRRRLPHLRLTCRSWVSTYNAENVDFVSKRVGNYEYNPQWGVLLDQLWVT